MATPLNQSLNLVGRLDDSPGEDTARQLFRRFLSESVLEVGTLRDYVEECLRNSGDQYDRALQDFVIYLGRFLGFEVHFGRYRGVQGQIGYDGHWKSPKGFHIVVEVKTTEAFAIKAATLVGYVDELVSEKEISSWENALGLYVIGRPDPEVRQLENAIVAEKRTSQLRVISVESLVSLAEMMNEYDIAQEDILAVLRPSGPSVDPIVDLMARLVAEPTAEELPPKEPAVSDEQAQREIAYWLSPVASDEEATAEETITTLVEQEQIYAFGERTPGRRHLKAGDRICFYATGKGVIAHADVASAPENKPHPRVRNSSRYPWTFRVGNGVLYLTDPVVLDSSFRSQLDAFQGRKPSKPWAWFVQATRKITAHDFALLTRQLTKNERPGNRS